MEGKASTRLVAVLMAAGFALAMPVASAFSVGVDASGIADMKSAGATPSYAQTWVGKWMRTSGWGGFESDLRTMRDNGATPVIQWYYWGDSISQNCVNWGCDGRSKSEWNSMAAEMGRRAEAVMGGKTFLIVLEPEFNKNGISGWETFDGYLAEQSRIIRAAAPSAKIVVGFGYWGGWDAFDRAVASSDYVGFQLLRASTRDSTSTATNAVQQIIDTSKALKSRFGKDVVVFDLDIGSYGGWEWVQERVLRDLAARRTEVDQAGVRVVIWRYVKDNDYSSGYFGPAESSWGVRHAWGGKKAAYDELVALVKVGTPSSTSTSTSTSGTSSGAPSGSVFTNVGGNEWWVQTDVSGWPTKVEARASSGAWHTLAKQSWGAYARSFHVPYGSTLELRATYGDGSVKTASMPWPPGAASAFHPTWSCVSAKNWWTQACVDAPGGVASVDVRVNGGAWQGLAKQSWGGWAKSFPLSPGQKVEFRATGSGGGSAVSGAYWSA